MSEKLKYKDRTQQKIEEERYETLKTIFTISFVLTDSIMVFDLVANFVLKELDELFFFRFFVAIFGLYGTLILIGGYYLTEYCDCEFDCQCCKFLDSFFSLGGCHYFLGGIFLIISYCIELCSIRYYFQNKDKVTEIFVISLLYLLFIFSTITIIILIILIINRKIEKRAKYKID